MWQLWTEVCCPEEGIIHNLEYESQHVDLIRYMKKFLCQKNQGVCYVIKHVRIEIIF